MSNGPYAVRPFSHDGALRKARCKGPATVASATQVRLSLYGSFGKRGQARSRRYKPGWASLANIPTGETRLRSS
jgi:hypothetical protein